MQIVIDIPEEIYKASQIIDAKYEDVIQIPLEVIKKGTPLPKGHGKLMVLSEDKLKENQINLDSFCQKWISEVGLSNATVTTIEADKGESEG